MDQKRSVLAHIAYFTCCYIFALNAKTALFTQSIIKPFIHFTTCIALFLFISFPASAQSNNWSVFGASGCGGVNQYKMNASVSSPSSTSFSEIEPLLDFYAPSGTLTAATSVYGGSGQLLFSVDQNGIFQKNGTMVWDFNTSLYSYTFSPAEYAVSEICTFPCVNDISNTKYWVVFWAYYNIDFHTRYKILRAIRVDIDPATGLASVDYTNDLELTDADATSGITSTPYDYDFAVAADAASCGGVRNVYTLDGWPNGGCRGSRLRKWVFDALGNPPSSSTPTQLNFAPYIIMSPKAKVVSISGHKYLAFLTTTNSCSALGIDWPNIVALWDLTSPYSLDVLSYNIGGSNGGTNAISGFEHITNSSGDYLYLSVANYYQGPTAPSFSLVPASSGLAFFDLVSPGYTAPDGTTSDYSFTDLEADKAGDLIMSNNSGELAYLSPGSLGAITVPTQITSSCSSAISVSNYLTPCYLFSAGTITFTKPYYLVKQIIGENYSSWGEAPYIVSGSETWTATSNPFGNASSISLNGITIPAGASLTIDGMTIYNAPNSYIDINEGDASTAGGRLVLLNGTVLTNNGSACSSGSNMWGGVRVWGSLFYSQEGVATKQGKLTMASSTISYAQTGVQLGEVSFTGLPRNGGIVIANSSAFENNSVAAHFYSYQNMSGGHEVNNRSYFKLSSFSSDDLSTVAGSTVYDIAGSYVKGVKIIGCSFANNIPSYTGDSYGIYGPDMGFIVQNDATGALVPVITPCTFSKFSTAVYHSVTSGLGYTPLITGATFNNNGIGVGLYGSIAAVATGNTFNVPISPVFPSSHTGGMVEAIGILLNSATLFSIYSNTFNSLGFFAPGSTTNSTVGILAENTQHGGEDNIINNNTFQGLNAANLANYRNNRVPSGSSINHGLWYKCNQNQDNNFDISTVGLDILNDGIRSYQGIPPLTPGYINGLPAGNIFTFNFSPAVYNIFIQDCIPLDAYYYAPTTLASPLTPGLPREQPGVLGITANYGGMIAGSLSSIVPPSPTITEDQCALPGPGDFWSSGLSGSSGHHIMDPTAEPDLENAHLATLHNVNYYMMDSGGLYHRDSLYYLAGELNTIAGDVLIVSMLIEDSLIDSANIVYNAIPGKYTLNNIETDEHNQGRNLIDIIISNRIHHYHDMHSLNSAQVDSLRDIVTYGKGWAHVRAENWLHEYDGSGYSDTLRFPTPHMPEPGPKGVLAVTELAKGTCGVACEYVEIIVANCGDDDADYVNVEGWIIDDNSGNFNTNGCGTNVHNQGIGHYRLARSPIWQNVKVGSIIVLYNHDANCYNFPDKFRIDNTLTGPVYWVPIGGTVAEPYDQPYVEGYYTSPDVTDCIYCDDAYLPYQVAADWDHTIELKTSRGAMQVRCPGCDSLTPGEPAFYNGIGYGDENFTSIPPGPAGLGGLVLSAWGNVRFKYVFDGATVADLAAPDKWYIYYSEEELGTTPPSLGVVHPDFMNLITTHIAGMPCCGTHIESRNAAANPIAGDVKGAKDTKDILVYPNPANTMLYVQFPVSGKTHIRLMDISGRVVNEQVIINNTTARIDLKGYIPGLYLYQVITEGKTQSGKVMIEK